MQKNDLIMYTNNIRDEISDMSKSMTRTIIRTYSIKVINTYNINLVSSYEVMNLYSKRVQQKNRNFLKRDLLREQLQFSLVCEDSSN